jgi:hypothetical protein
MVVDYTGLEFAELAEMMDQSRARITRSNKNGILLMEVARDVRAGKDESAAVRQYISDIKPYVGKYAVVGIDGLTRVLTASMKILKLIDFETFDTEEEAKEYLVS